MQKWKPYNFNGNLDFTNGSCVLTVPEYVEVTALAVIPIWNTNNFSGEARAENGKIKLTGYTNTTPANGTFWLDVVGIFQYK